MNVVALGKSRFGLPSVAILIPIFALFLLVSRSFARTHDVETSLCGGHFVIVAKTGIDFSDVETRLICGDPKTPAWAHPSDSEALFHIKTFLQDHAYYSPILRGQEGQKRIVIAAGDPIQVSKWQVVGAPPGFRPSRFRHIVGELLTPTLLNDVKERVAMELADLGYACAHIDIEADSDTGQILVTVQPGMRKVILSVSKKPVPGIDANVLSRYWAFRLGDYYDRRNLSVTSNRILNANLLQNTHFIPLCEPEGVKLREDTVPSDPRLFTVGLGVNTERWVLAKTSWKDVRLGNTASRFEANLLASYQYQELNAILQWYYHSYPSRHHFEPSIDIKRENVDLYDRVTSTFALTPATSWDNQNLGLTLVYGPTLNYVHLIRGTGPRDSKFLGVNLDLVVKSHPYEYWQYVGAPETGFRLEFVGSATQKDILSPVSAQSGQINFLKLWNLGNWEPPAFILGVRGTLATTITSENVFVPNALPQNYLYYLGGSTDLRGFNRPELPGPMGALSEAFVSVELRWPDVLPWGLQPLVFTDAAMLGEKTFDLERFVYWSPGFGIRWQTKIGVIRTTLAHGFISESPKDPRSHWQFYFSFGEEF